MAQRLLGSTAARRIAVPFALAMGVCLCLDAESLAGEKIRFRFLAAIAFDEKGVGLRQPEAVACDDRSTLIVGDTGNNRLLRYRVEERGIKPAGAISAPELSYPIRLHMNARGDVFALDGKRRRIVRFDAAGAYQEAVSPQGLPAPTSVVPRSFKIDRNDHLYILDIFSARVLVLDPEAKYQRHLDLPKDAGFFSDLAVDGKGTVFVIDSVNARVSAAAKNEKAFSPLGRSLREHLSFPTSITVDSRGILYLVDENGSGVVMLGQDGSFLGRQLVMGWNEGLLYYPSQMCVNDRGEAFIADRGNSRVQVFAIMR
jgi:sugar lactone lactonase YvrE